MAFPHHIYADSKNLDNCNNWSVHNICFSILLWTQVELFNVLLIFSFLEEKNIMRKTLLLFFMICKLILVGENIDVSIIRSRKLVAVSEITNEVLYGPDNLLHGFLNKDKYKICTLLQSFIIVISFQIKDSCIILFTFEG